MRRRVGDGAAGVSEAGSVALSGAVLAESTVLAAVVPDFTVASATALTARGFAGARSAGGSTRVSVRLIG
jgi:hypothetical protein